MRILALEVEKPGVSADEIKRHLADEARKVWELNQDEFIREIYFRADKPSAVLMLECDDIGGARRRLSELPLVAAGLIDFELIPLAPYPGYARLFRD